MYLLILVAWQHGWKMLFLCLKNIAWHLHHRESNQGRIRGAFIQHRVRKRLWVGHCISIAYLCSSSIFLYLCFKSTFFVISHPIFLFVLRSIRRTQTELGQQVTSPFMVHKRLVFSPRKIFWCL
jgi:hypothetical protein